MLLPLQSVTLLQDVSLLDVRGSVRTKLQSTNAQGCRLEMSEYFADYDTYLEGHIPGEARSSPRSHFSCIVWWACHPTHSCHHVVG